MTAAACPITIPNAICMHEEDVGLLWKHYDWQAQDSEVRRSRRFVISSIITAANYEYAFYWYLYQDGTIETEVKLTGIVLTSAVAPGRAGRRTAAWSARGCRRSTTSTSSACGWTWPSTGTANDLHEVHTEAVPVGPENPYGNAFRAVATHLRSERRGPAADRPAERAVLAGLEPGAAQRRWAIRSPTS